VYVFTFSTFVRRLIVLIPGYRWLFEVPKILHRDISQHNLMLRKEDDKIYGVLNDLDLAVDADVKSASSKQLVMCRARLQAVGRAEPSPFRPS